MPKQNNDKPGDTLDNLANAMYGRVVYALLFKGSLFPHVLGVFFTVEEAKRAANKEVGPTHDLVWGKGNFAYFLRANRDDGMYFEIQRVAFGFVASLWLLEKQDEGIITDEE